MSRRSRGTLRLGKPDPGPTQPNFSMEDVGFQRLYLGTADATDFLPQDRTGNGAAVSGGEFTISGAADTDTYSTATVAGTCTRSAGQPHNAYVSALWTWKMFDILGNPVTGSSPCVLQWSIVMTDRSATGGNYPYSSGTDPKSWIALGACAEDADNVAVVTTRPPLSGFENKTAANTERLIYGNALCGENMTGQAGIADGKFMVATVTMAPDDGGTCTVGPMATTLYACETAGTNTFAGQNIHDSKHFHFDTGGKQLAPDGTTQLNWMFALGRQTISAASDTSGVEWRFRLYARAIPAQMYSSSDASWRGFAQTWL